MEKTKVPEPLGPGEVEPGQGYSPSPSKSNLDFRALFAETVEHFAKGVRSTDWGVLLNSGPVGEIEWVPPSRAFLVSPEGVVEVEQRVPERRIYAGPVE